MQWRKMKKKRKRWRERVKERERVPFDRSVSLAYAASYRFTCTSLTRSFKIEVTAERLFLMHQGCFRGFNGTRLHSPLSLFFIRFLGTFRATKKFIRESSTVFFSGSSCEPRSFFQVVLPCSKMSF